MWKDYSLDYLKNNRASSLSVRIAAFISAVLLSLLSSLFYNLWVYEIERLKVEEGSWQGRLTGEIDEEALETVRNYANVESISINEELSGEEETVVDVLFRDKRDIFTDMPRIAGLAGLSEEAVSYHYSLLNMYLIRSSQDTALRWVFPFSCMVAALACLSLILVIHNAFAVTMHARIHQFGIFSSIGATPAQIRACLLQEAFVLCAGPVAVGNLCGILIAMGILTGANVLLADVARRLVLPFTYHPLVLVLSLLASALTIGISAGIPARKLSRMTPLEAIRNTGELQLKRKRKARLLSFLFGIEGEIAGNALKAQKKAMRTASVSLMLSFWAFSFMMCFLVLMEVSQQETYFEKYQDAWDMMITVKNTEIDAFEGIEALQKLQGVQSVVVYQKAEAKRIVTEEEISEELQAIGGFGNDKGGYVTAVKIAGETEKGESEGTDEAESTWMVNAPLVIMDDTSFLDYCERIGAVPNLDGAVILNRTLDAADPNFRKRKELPYLTGTGETTLLRQAGQESVTAEIPVLAYTQEPPVLKEEYGTLDFYELVHFIPVSCWKRIKGQIDGLEEDLYVRILAGDGVALEELSGMGDAASALLGQEYEAEIENRIQDKLDNDRMFWGMKAVVSVFCVLLAFIGIGNVFSNTFGFVRQRKREFARLLSVGMTPEEMKRIFLAEAFAVAGKPVLLTLPVTAAAVGAFIKMSYLEPPLFLQEMPFLPIAVFILAIFGFVGLAYYLGAKKVLGSSLMDALRDDTVI